MEKYMSINTSHNYNNYYTVSVLRSIENAQVISFMQESSDLSVEEKAQRIGSFFSDVPLRVQQALLDKLDSAEAEKAERREAKLQNLKELYI